MKKYLKITFYVLAALVAVFALTLVMPAQRVHMPVARATVADYNQASFWYYPWGEQRHHIGVDIFAPEGREVHPACSGIVIKAGHSSGRGGNVVDVLGTRGRVYYYAHLSEVKTHVGAYVTPDDVIGLVGRTGNANRPGCPSHLHFTIFTMLPQSHDLAETQASRDSRDHFVLTWPVDPIAELNKTAAEQN